jgi:alkylation response protein AidB-like acyl-CoA dehydrogenase
MKMDKQVLKGSEYLVKAESPAEVFTPEDFTDEQRQIAETTTEFVNNEILPHVAEIDAGNFDLVVQGMKKCGELGLLMIDGPEEYGGLELDKATSMLAAEKIAPSGSFSVAYACHTGIATLPLVYYGTSAQKTKYLQKILTGEWLGAYCLTEPGSGSDALGARTTATLSDDGKYYILNGTKQFITNGSFADLYTVFAQVDKTNFTAFLVERTFDGLVVGAEEKKLGIKGSSTTQIILDNCQVPVENVLGEIGKGHKIAFNVLNVGRFKLGAAVTGAAKEAMAVGIAYANERKQFNTPIARFGAIGEKIADMQAGLFASESMIYRLAGLIDTQLARLEKGSENYYELYQQAIEDYSVECAIIKVFCSEVLANVVDEVVQIHGGYGFTAEYPAERFYRDERINRIFEGTNEINRLLIPGMILRKAMKGELPLQSEGMKAFQSLMTPSFELLDESDPFAAERALVANLKTLFLILAGAAVQKYGVALQHEQEMLMAAADLAIEIFAIESSLLRIEKICSAVSDSKRAQLMAVLKSIAFHGAERAATAAKRGAFYIEEGDTLTMILSGVRRFTRYDASGLLQAKRLLVEAACASEKYLF